MPSAPGPALANAALVALLARCGKRDQSAFSELYQKTSSKLFGVALRILRREEWAAEVLQDCYVSLWTNAVSYNATVATPMTWMVSIVRHRALDGLRRPRFEISAEVDDDEGANLIDRAASADPSPLELLSGARNAARLGDCLGQLEARQRQAIALAFYDGLSHSEVAVHLREPLGTVKTWVRRGLIRLKDCLTTA